MTSTSEVRIEIYVRHSSNGTMLTFHAPEASRSGLARALSGGQLSAGDVPIGLELAILPEWITNAEVREKFTELQEPIRLRIPISSINTNFGK